MKSNRKIAALAGVLSFGLLASLMGAYGLSNYATRFQIQPVNNNDNTQTVALGAGCTLGADAGSTVNLSSGSVSLPGLTLSAGQGVIPSGGSLTSQAGSTVNLSAGTLTLPGLTLTAGQGVIPSGGTLTSQSGSTVNLSAGTVTLPTLQGVNFAGSNGTGNCSLVNSSSGQKVLTIWDVTGGTATAASSAGASSFASIVSGTGVLVQSSTANLSARIYSAILSNQGP